MSQLREEGIRAFLWDFLGKLFTQGSAFLVTVLLARLLAPSEFGQVAMIMVVIGMAGIFTDMGLGGALIQRQDVRSSHYSTVFFINCAAGAVLCVAMYYSAGLIARFYNQAELQPLVQALSFLFLLDSFSSTQTTILRKTLNYKVLARARFLSSLFSGLIALIMACFGWGVWSLVVQALAMSLVYNALIWAWSRWRPGLEFSGLALRELWSFGFRMFLAGLLDTVVTRIDYLLIGKLFTPATLGYYQRAKSLNNLVSLYSSGSLMSVLFPLLSNVQDDVERFRRITIGILSLINFVTFLLLGFLFVISEDLILLLFGEQWRESAQILQILVVSSFAYPISALMVTVLRSRGKAQRFLRLEILKKIIVMANLVILFVFGIQAYLFGLILVAVIGLSLNVVYAAVELELMPGIFAKPIVWQFGVAATAVAVTQYVQLSWLMHDTLFLNMIAKAASFAFAYFLCSYFLQLESYKEFSRQLLYQLRNRA